MQMISTRSRPISGISLVLIDTQTPDAEPVEFLPPHDNDPFDRILMRKRWRDLAIVSADVVLDK
jgi:PIN domain nuclease of toxin-antitoxin system